MNEYDDNRPATLFQRGNITEGSSARRWLEAENDSAVFAVIIEWFQMMEQEYWTNPNGTSNGVTLAEMQYPDPDWRDRALLSLTQEQADGMIAEIDADFELERNRFPDTGLGPEFSRLLPHARMAFAQAIYRVLKTDAQLEAEAQARVATGEAFPPAEAPREGSTG